ncbi:MAG TPA: hypothetical protein DEP51_07530 [Clostridiales bacterium]|nr:hypothetical protein [Clostridiales bacterium]
MSKILSKILVVLLLSIIFISNAHQMVNAAFEISEAYIQKIGDADYHLKYYKEEKGMYTYCTCSIVGHYQDGKFYPAYCLNRDMHGVGAVENYSVDVDSLIDNNAVWRAVKNGYPYKSAGEMGLSSDFDAFAVTKFAIYCLIGQADINLYTADEGDEEGQAMLNALHNLVNIGLNGSGSFKNELKISQKGELTEDGEYYFLVYKVTSGTTIQSYDIKSVSGLSNGELITDTKGNIKTSFNSGENFKIKIPKQSLNSDKNINIQIEAKLKSYPLYYGKTRITGTQNYLLTANSYQNINSEINTNLKLNTGKILINKVDSDTKEAIEDAEFELYNSKNEKLGTYLTNKNGKIEIPNLYQGKYYLKETKTNENYILDENTEFSVDVVYNKTSTIDIENKHKTGNLTINKVDKDNNDFAIENVGFELYSEDSKLIGSYFTDKNGKIEIKDLRTGNYRLKEISTNEWYNLADETNLEIKWNETTEKTIENELKKGQIRIIKVDKDNHEVKLKNVVFEVLDAKDNVLEKITTNEDGEALTKEYSLRDYGKLRLREIETNELYDLNNEIKEIVLEENQIKDIVFENEKIKGKVKIVKKTSEKSDITGLEKGAVLEGVKFEIYNENGKIVDTLQTDSEGIAISKDLEKGKYKIKEVETSKWYLLDENERNVEVTTNNQIITLTLENQPAKPDEEIVKTGPEKALAREEIEYRINIQNTGNVPLDNFIWEDEIPTDYIKVNKMNLGTFNQDNSYNLYYKTNLKNEYILLLEDVSSKTAEEIDFSKELSSDEYVTNIKIDFGTVYVGFKTENETIIKAKVNSNVKRDDIFENKVLLTSNYKGFNLSKPSSWKTTIYEILPLTGM